MSLFYASATPMLKTLSDATSKFVSDVSSCTLSLLIQGFYVFTAGGFLHPSVPPWNVTWGNFSLLPVWVSCSWMLTLHMISVSNNEVCVRAANCSQHSSSAWCHMVRVHTEASTHLQQFKQPANQVKAGLKAELKQKNKAAEAQYEIQSVYFRTILFAVFLIHRTVCWFLFYNPPAEGSLSTDCENTVW